MNNQLINYYFLYSRGKKMRWINWTWLYFCLPVYLLSYSLTIKVTFGSLREEQPSTAIDSNKYNNEKLLRPGSIIVVDDLLFL